MDRPFLFAVATQALLLCAGCNSDHLRLIDAAEAGEVAAVTALIEQGVDVNRTDHRKNQVLGIVTGGAAMREAAAHGHGELLRLPGDRQELGRLSEYGVAQTLYSLVCSRQELLNLLDEAPDLSAGPLPRLFTEHLLYRNNIVLKPEYRVFFVAG